MARKIPGCFGSEDKVFSCHPFDRERAKDMLEDALSENATWDEIEKEIRDYLKGCQQAHIDEQVERAKDVSSYTK